MNVKLVPWIVPNFVTGEMPAGKREDGFHPDMTPKWPLSEVDADELAAQCDKFREEVFRKAGKVDPVKAALNSWGEVNP